MWINIMSSRNCESCLGKGEKPGIGHMPGYTCKKCSGTGKIHNFNDVVQSDAQVNEASVTSIEKSKIVLPLAVYLDKPKRGRPKILKITE